MNNPVIVVGAGLAGLSAALALAPLPVLLIAAAPLGEQAASAWAQGGIAAAVGPDDSPTLHARDTLDAGDGLCNPAVVARITAAGPALIATLAAAGAGFDRDPVGALALGLEAAHGRRRIVHAADGTGREVMRALINRVRATPSITLLENHSVQALALANQTVRGVALDDGQVIAARAVVLATGGIGGLYPHTTNPRGAWGQGLLLAARVGATLIDLEFVQFHPTALDVGRDPMPLISEAVRGEGATLIDETGARFMAGQGRAELEPRDVVSRAVAAHQAAGHHVFLQAQAIAGFARHFPAVTAFCAAAGIDPATQPIPIRPAAHYHMGGIETDADGRTTVPGLYACGECAGTGLHGANRLASNSLLEAAVCGAAVARAILAEPAPAPRHPHAPAIAAARPDPAPVRPIMGDALFVLRDGAALHHAIQALAQLATSGGPAADPAIVALMIALAADRRRESRGAHHRTDFPDRAPIAARGRLTLLDALTAARATDRRAA